MNGSKKAKESSKEERNHNLRIEELLFSDYKFITF